MAKRDFRSADFAKKMQSTIEKSEMSGNSVTSVDIRLDKIDENPDNEVIFNMDDIERLAHAIQELGFSGAIEVFKKEDGRYEIVSGHRRLRAMKLLGKETIPAIVSSKPDRIQLRKKLVGGNINNRDMKPMDWARVILYQRNTYYIEDAEKYNKALDETPEGFDRYTPIDNVNAKLEADFGMKRSQLSHYMRLNKLIPELQEFVDAEYVAFSCVYVLSSNTEGEQREVFQAIKNEWDMMSADEDGYKRMPSVTVNRIINSTLFKMKNQAERDAGLNRTSILLNKPVPEPTELQYAEPDTSSPSDFDVEEKMSALREELEDNSQSEPQVISHEEPEFKHYIENPVPVKDDTPDFTPTYAGMPLDFDSNKDVLPTPAKTFKPFIDSSIDSLALQLERVLDVDYDIQDKDAVSKSLNKLEELIAKIRSEL